MLLMVLAQSAIVRTAKMGGSIEMQWHLRGLVIVADVFIVIDVRGYQHLMEPMRRTIFEHIYIIVLKNDLGINPSQAFGAKA
jgi:hypothetical protein